VRAFGSLVVPRWGMGLAILFTAIAFGSFLLSYFYLRIENAAWPPAGVEDPSLPVAAVCVALVAAAWLQTQRALRAIQDDDGSGLRTRLVLALLLGVGGVGVLVRDLLGLGFGSTDHAYGSVFHTLAGFAIAVTVIALVMAAAIIGYGLRGEYNARRFSPVENVSRFWTATAVIWTGTIAVLYGTPYLT
jgi:heme/copper-type cytochrome/quinol oxidase subunit 3